MDKNERIISFFKVFNNVVGSNFSLLLLENYIDVLLFLFDYIFLFKFNMVFEG